MQLRDVCVEQEYIYTHNLDIPTYRPEAERDKYTGTKVTVTRVPKKGESSLITVELFNGRDGAVYACELSEVPDED